jgi:hypothetical protein
MGIRDLIMNRRSGQDRRRGDDRRQNEGMAADPERREGERRQGERRKLVYSVRYGTHDTLVPAEMWLDTHCQGEWSMVLDDVSADLKHKVVLVMFERDDDRQQFIAAFKKR